MRAHSEQLKLTMSFYCELMQEIKIRDLGIDRLQTSEAPAQIVYESSYLQLRMICELIAMACLVIHGDIPATKTRKMTSTWSAEEIIKRLSNLHSDFYPRPVSAEPGNKFKITDITSGFLTKADLLDLNGKCGDRLHRGTVKNVRQRINPQNVSFEQVKKWQRMIGQLLNHHWIKLHDSDDQIGVQMMPHGQSPSWNYWAVTKHTAL